MKRICESAAGSRMTWRCRRCTRRRTCCSDRSDRRTNTFAKL